MTRARVTTSTGTGSTTTSTTTTRTTARRTGARAGAAAPAGGGRESHAGTDLQAIGRDISNDELEVLKHFGYRGTRRYTVGDLVEWLSVNPDGLERACDLVSRQIFCGGRHLVPQANPLLVAGILAVAACVAAPEVCGGFALGGADFAAGGSLVGSGAALAGTAVRQLRTATDVVAARNLARQLASEEQMAQRGVRIAGAGTGTSLRAAQRRAQDYGGAPDDWVKMSSFDYIGSDGFKFEIHWYENVVTRRRVEFKVKFEWIAPRVQ